MIPLIGMFRHEVLLFVGCFHAIYVCEMAGEARCVLNTTCCLRSVAAEEQMYTCS